jgi:hypothetical protein
MDFSLLPPELFAWIVAYLVPTVAVKLERVCKSWHENLNVNQQIWKVSTEKSDSIRLLPTFSRH